MHVPIGIKEMQRKSEVVHISTGFSCGKVYVEVPHNMVTAVIYLWGFINVILEHWTLSSLVWEMYETGIRDPIL